MTDKERLDWLERHLFESKWNGVMGAGCETQWRLAGNYRHVMRDFNGPTLRDAIDYNAEVNELVPKDD